MEEVAHGKDARPGHDHVDEFVHHHEVVHFEVEVDHVVRAGSRILQLLLEVSLVLRLDRMNLNKTQGSHDFFTRLACGEGGSHFGFQRLILINFNLNH